MVSVHAEMPTRCYFEAVKGSYSFGVIGLSFGSILVMDEMTDKTDIELDLGYIHSYQSVLPACNNCEQYDVEGDITLSSNGGAVITYATPDEASVSKLPAVTITFDDGKSETRNPCAAIRRGMTTGTIYGQVAYYRRPASPKRLGWIQQMFVDSIDTYEDHYVFNCSSTLEWYAWSGVGLPDVLVKTEEDHSSVPVTPIRRGTVHTIDPKEDFLTSPFWLLYQYSGHSDSTMDIIRRLKTRADQQSHFGTLAAKAAESIRLSNINTVAYLRDFTKLRDYANVVLDVAGLKTAAALPKVVSGAYLAYHYGLHLSVLDTEEIAKGIERIDFEHQYQSFRADDAFLLDLPGSNSVSVASRRWITGQVANFTNEQLYFLDKVAKAKRGVYELDIFPSFSNVWDLLPFSFVVDWFLPIGDAAEILETKNYMQTLQVHKCFLSQKYTWRLSPETSGTESSIRGQLSFKYYERVCQHTLPLPPINVENPHFSPTHVVEGAALILANI